MVYRGGKPVLSFGVMGGQYQAMGQTYVLSNWIDYGMDIQQSLDAARFLLYDGVLDVEDGVPAATREAQRSPRRRPGDRHRLGTGRAAGRLRSAQGRLRAGLLIH
jgi:gamma-glutamyltranspeptidase